MNRFAFRRQLRRELARGCDRIEISGEPMKLDLIRLSEILPPSSEATPAPASPSYRPPTKLIDLSRVSSSMERDWGKSRG